MKHSLLSREVMWVVSDEGKFAEEPFITLWVEHRKPVTRNKSQVPKENKTN